ncbi:MAG: hypothetical protein ACK4NS_01110 [Saprospiraceae bacterium]
MKKRKRKMQSGLQASAQLNERREQEAATPEQNGLTRYKVVLINCSNP